MGRLFVAVELPWIVSVVKPRIPMKLVGTCAVKSTTEVTALPDLVTVAVTFDSIELVCVLSCALKILVASVAPAGIDPSADMVAAAARPGEDFATEPTLAESAAARSWLR